MAFSPAAALADSATCKTTAWFLHDLGLGWLFMLVPLLLLPAVLIVLYLGSLAHPGATTIHESQTVPLPITTAATPFSPPPSYTENAADVAQQERPSLSNKSQAHPNRAETAEERNDTDPHPSTYIDVRWAVPRSTTSPRKDLPLQSTSSDSTFSEHDSHFDPTADAPRFVQGTAALLFLGALLFLYALDLQAWTYCQGASPWAVGPGWIIFGGLALFSLRGFGAWLVLLRNLWGKRGREAWAVQDDFLMLGVVHLVGLVLLAPYRGVVAGVRSCQGGLCGSGTREPDEDLEMGVTPRTERFKEVEAEEPMGMKVEGPGEMLVDSEERRGEREGLLTGTGSSRS